MSARTCSAALRPALSSRKTLDVADFNEDGLPDIFVGSDGFSYPEGIGRNRLFLSTGDGHEVDATANLPLDQSFAWATVADVNGDGHLDLFVDYPFSNGNPPPEIRVGDGRGHFVVEPGALPATSVRPITRTPRVPSPMSTATARPTSCLALSARPATRSCC